MSEIRFSTFPKTEKPKEFALDVVNVFKNHLGEISTVDLEKGLDSDTVLGIIRDDLVEIGFEVEKSKKKEDKIFRPVFLW